MHGRTLATAEMESIDRLDSQTIPRKEGAADRLEDCNCPVCGSTDRTLIHSIGDPYRSNRCRSCGQAYLSPRLTESAMAARYGSADYFSGGESGYASYASQELSLRMTFRRLLKWTRKRSWTGGDFLDVGCGYGYLLDEAKPYFNRRVGTDLSLEAVERAREVADLVAQGGVEALPRELSFQVVTCFHVIEHVYDPIAFVRAIVDRLAPHGRLILSTPDFGSGWRRLLGRRWPSYKPPEHVTYFDRRTLESLMLKAGLEDLEVVPYPHAFPIGLVCKKLRLPVPDGNYPIWIRGTTIAVAGRRRG